MGDKFKLVLKIEERFNAGNAQRKVFGTQHHPMQLQ